MAQSLAERTAIGDRLRLRLEPHQAALSGWMAVWVTIGLLVVLIVVGFLVGIVGALRSVDGSLANATQAVTGVQGDTNTLPGLLQRVNANLANVSANTDPLDGQAAQIVSGLTAVRTDLQRVDSSLGTTGGTLTDVSGTLQSTEATLNHILSLAGQIDSQLHAAQDRNSLGTNEIWRRVAAANGSLQAVKADTGNITTGLDHVNQHLASICKAVPPPFGQSGLPCG